jgi:ketosteroid isomerase-like protein
MTRACPNMLPETKPRSALDMLIERSEASNAALLRGDIERYTALLSLAPDFTLMSPFGGQPSHGKPTPEALHRIGEFFKNGSLEQELVQAYATDDMVVLALIERARVEVGGLPSQDWALRVTLVYRRDDREWRLVHRHADPLVEGISVSYAAQLARGERPLAELNDRSPRVARDSRATGDEGTKPRPGAARRAARGRRVR